MNERSPVYLSEVILYDILLLKKKNINNYKEINKYETVNIFYLIC